MSKHSNQNRSLVPYVGTCRNCGKTVKAKILTKRHSSNPQWKRVRCSQCGTTNSVNPKDNDF